MHRIEGENVAYTTDGTPYFSTVPPYTVVTPEFMTSVQEEIMNVITQAGLPLLSQSNDTNDQLATAIQRISQRFDYYVTSQETFDDLFTRTGANTYKINSQYKSVYIREVTGGYSVASILSDGDTWGDIYTNQCTHLEFENGAYLNFGNLPGNITAETEGGLLRNVDVRGSATVAAAITESFKLAASHVTFDNCKTSVRLSNTTFNGFEGSGTAAHNQTSRYIGCASYILDSSGDVSGFESCSNMTECTAYDIDSSGANDGYGFNSCDFLSSCHAYDIDSVGGTAYGFDSCTYKDISCYSDEATTQLDIGASFYTLGQGGFGTTSVKGAQGVVHIANGTNADTNWQTNAPLVVENDNNCIINIRTPNVNQGYLAFSDTDAIFSGLLGYDHSNDYMVFYTGGVGGERMRLNATGLYLGGGASASNLLHVQGTTTPQMRIAYDGSNYVELQLNSAGNFSITPTGDYVNILEGHHFRVYSSDNGEYGDFEHNDSNLVISTGGTSAGNIVISNTTDSSSKDTGALIVEGGVGIEKKLYVGDNLTVVDGHSAVTESFNAGGAHAGYFYNSATSWPITPSHVLRLEFSGASPDNNSNWFISAVDTTTSRFIVYSDVDVVNHDNSYGAISDIKLKENIKNTNDVLDKILKIQVRDFNFKTDPKDKIQTGMIAQEIEDIFPNFVKNSIDDKGEEIKTLGYSKFIPILIKAIQEQQKIIDKLKN